MTVLKSELSFLQACQNCWGRGDRVGHYKLTLDITEDANSFKGVQKEEVVTFQTTDQNMIIYLFILLVFNRKE